MAVIIGANVTKVKTIRVVKQGPTIKKIVVGRPVRQVTEAAHNLDALTDVEISSLNDGDVLVYEQSSSKWKNTLTLDKQDITGGQY